MKKFIDFCLLFALYIYKTYIYENWSIYTKTGKIMIYWAWFTRSLVIWLICPIFIPEYFFKQTTIYSHIKKLQDSPEYKTQMSKTINKFNM